MGSQVNGPRKFSHFGLLTAMLALAGDAFAAEGGQVLRLDHEIDIAAPADAVWTALTTPEGLRWIAPEALVELEVGGRYELHFFPDNPEDKGMEGTHVLAFVPGRLLVTEGEIEGSWVVWNLSPAAAGTHLTVSSSGRGAEWSERAPYFDKAMPGVLRRLAEHVEARRDTAE